ncbi:serine/threonine protein kinase [Dictyobacter alpinus]|uniref:serine/threonine protein kinase n=1 Tax=Dictyobacter alpinus TaxID=2014873 RepID=UPI001387686E|nr:serine/threonine-protein kinase [Dictyobacter alpinus]
MNTVIAHYAITWHIAKGGMSNIYLARDIYTDQEVALKLVHTSHGEYCQRFQREAQVIASLQHEHILPALDYGEVGSWCYMVTPYVPNGTLRARTHDGPLSLDEAGKYLTQIASALHYAHQRGIVHRDVKSSNILMLNEDFVYLADFGLAKNMSSVAESLTESGFLVGTPEYMAPELAEEAATHLSDIYSLGIVLYQMLTGDVPFKGSTPVGTFMQHLSRQPARPSQVNPRLPTEVDNVVLRALAKEPAQRYQSALELAQAYQHMLDSSRQPYMDDNKDISALQTVTPVVSASSQRRKQPRLIAGAAVVLAASAALALGAPSNIFHSMNIHPDSAITNSVIQSDIASAHAKAPIIIQKDKNTNPVKSVTPSSPINSNSKNTNGNTHTPSTNANSTTTQTVSVSRPPSQSNTGNSKNGGTNSNQQGGGKKSGGPGSKPSGDKKSGGPASKPSGGKKGGAAHGHDHGGAKPGGGPGHGKGHHK